MSKEQIPDGVGRTAIGVARVRAHESTRRDRLFNDPYAAAFVVADGRRDLAVTAKPSPGLIAMVRHLVLRTRFFDDYLLAAAESGCRQVVVPAAGLDTRAFRLDWPAGTRFFELDMPAVLAFKERVLAEQGAQPAGPRTVIAIDLREDWATALTSAGFDPTAPTVWLLEGLLVYLDSDDVEAILATVTGLSAPGSRLALTHGLGNRGRRQAPEPHAPEHAAAELTDVVALWRGGLNEDPVAWLDRHGWRARRNDRADVAVAVGRGADYVTSQRSFVTAER
ncbi:class I SAM-dependent methyltransferase [Kitasatospora acidiphila]|uniref:class I SAM-dependent methyltransferase n=1 Tax=Kitasatospora acidiphila TaxID=2567942 RepID=UPI003C723546